MFSLKEKQMIADAIERLLLQLAHPEMPTEKPKFTLHVEGKESWSWADIQPNWTFENKEPEINPWNETARKVMTASACAHDMGWMITFEKEGKYECACGFYVSKNTSQEQGEIKMNKTYLGDGVYVDFDGGIILTAENGVEVTSKIYLEPEVIRALFDFVYSLENKIVQPPQPSKEK